MNSSSENQVPSVTGNRSGVEHTLSASDNAAIVNERGSLKRQTLKRTPMPLPAHAADPTPGRKSDSCCLSGS